MTARKQRHADLPQHHAQEHAECHPDHGGQGGHDEHANAACGYPQLVEPQRRVQSSLMDEWLLAEPTVERLDLDDASWVDVVRGLVPRGDDVHEAVMAAAAWEQGQVFRYERWIDSPRLMAAAPAGTHGAIDAVDGGCGGATACAFDAPALALYRNERDSVAFHRDRELRWLDDTVIAVLTFGARRPWLMKPLPAGAVTPTTRLTSSTSRPPAATCW